MTQITTPSLGSGTTTRTPTAHRVVIAASLIALTADLVLMAIIGAVVPPLLIFAVLTALVVAATRRWPRGGLIALGLIALAANGGGVPFLVADLSSPADPIAFLWAVLSGGGRVVAIVGVVLTVLGRDEAVRRLAVASVGILAVALVGTTVARITTGSSDGRQIGDVAVVATGFAYPDEVTVEQGAVLYLDNRDPLRHTFAVAGTDLEVMLQPGVKRRMPVDLAPGTYEFVCTVPGHEFMTGTLEVQ